MDFFSDVKYLNMDDKRFNVAEHVFPLQTWLFKKKWHRSFAFLDFAPVLPGEFLW
jgi:hypothetical protein